MRPELEQLIPLVDAISATFEGISEVVLHDIADPNSSIVYIKGNLTSRGIGGPSTSVVLNALRMAGDKAKDIIGYITKGPDGKILKSSTIFIRDRKGKIVGTFCVNIDITGLMPLKDFLTSLIMTSSKKDEGMLDEHFARDINEIAESLIRDAVNELGKPVELMDKDEKIKVVQMLDKKGLFLVKGAVTRVARALQVSRFTIYNYLEDVRISDDDEN